MTGFRNTVGSAALTNWVSPSSDRIAFGRGNVGFVIINNDDAAWGATFTTGLPDGVYTDVISGSANFTVSGGQLKTAVPIRDAIALHVGAKA